MSYYPKSKYFEFVRHLFVTFILLTPVILLKTVIAEEILSAKQNQLPINKKLEIAMDSRRQGYDKQAFKFFKSAASDGDMLAQFYTGLYYYDGNIVEQDYSQATQYFSRAAKQGHIKALDYLSKINALERDGKRSESEQNSLNEILLVASLQVYKDGLTYLKEGGELNYELAFKAFKSSETAGNSQAALMLGLMYLQGHHVESNLDKAFEYIQKSALMGNESGQYYLGEAYKYGNLKPKDYTKAFQWYKLAAEQNHILAQHNLGMFYSNGYGVPKNLASAVNWFKKAAKQGDAHSQHNMGVSYERGWGVDKDIDKAKYWYQQAAEQNFEDSKIALANLETKREVDLNRSSENPSLSDFAKLIVEAAKVGKVMKDARSSKQVETTRNETETNQCHSNARGRIVECVVMPGGCDASGCYVDADCGESIFNDSGCEYHLNILKYDYGTWYCDRENKDYVDRDINVVIAKICS